MANVPPQNQRECASRFSMVELIAVMVVMTILMTITVVSFSNMAKGTAVNQAARDIGGAIHLTRRLATAQRRYAALILPGPAGAEDLGIDEKHLYRAYRVALVNVSSDEDFDFEFDRWTDNSRWLWVPGGTTIMEADGVIGVEAAGIYGRAPQDDDYTTVGGVDLNQLNGGTDVGFPVRAIVFSPSGRLMGDEAYVTVGRATYSGGSWDVIDPATLEKNRSCANQFSIQVNRFTGSVRYRTPSEY